MNHGEKITSHRVNYPMGDGFNPLTGETADQTSPLAAIYMTKIDEHTQKTFG